MPAQAPDRAALAQEAAAARPRRLLEQMDDAWRLALADAPMLLALVFLFWLPASSVIVALVALPEAGWWLAPLAATLLLCTGLASGACQEAFHSWAEPYPVRIWECLAAACKRAPLHLASQALSLAAPAGACAFFLSPVLPKGIGVLGGIMLLLLALGLAMFGITRQASFTAGKARFWPAVRLGFRAARASVLLLLLLRGVLLFFALFNLHLLLLFVLWAAEDLAGLDLAYVGVICSLGNGAYFLALGLVAWTLLQPFQEAVGYLYFVDLRTREEGFDLWERIQTRFPLARANKVGVLLTATALGWSLPGVVRGEAPLAVVRSARAEVKAIHGEVEQATPFPGSKAWVPRLDGLRRRLEQTAVQKDGFRWLAIGVKEFAGKNQMQALQWLDDLDARLALMEDSLNQPAKQDAIRSSKEIKDLIPPNSREARKIERPPEKEEEPNKAQDPFPNNNGAGAGGGLIPAGGVGLGGAGLAGVGYALVICLILLLILVLGAVIVYALHAWRQSRIPSSAKQAGALRARAEEDMLDPQRLDPGELWRQADERAKAGDFLGAVRILYLAVLTLLHRAGSIRYERTRTNGEYADQLRRRPVLYRPFLNLTGLFELKWYGERSCNPADFERCRDLAEEIRAGSLEKAAGPAP